MFETLQQAEENLTTTVELIISGEININGIEGLYSAQYKQKIIQKMLTETSMKDATIKSSGTLRGRVVEKAVMTLEEYKKLSFKHPNLTIKKAYGIYRLIECGATLDYLLSDPDRFALINQVNEIVWLMKAGSFSFHVLLEQHLFKEMLTHAVLIKQTGTSLKELRNYTIAIEHLMEVIPFSALLELDKTQRSELFKRYTTVVALIKSKVISPEELLKQGDRLVNYLDSFSYPSLRDEFKDSALAFLEREKEHSPPPSPLSSIICVAAKTSPSFFDQSQTSPVSRAATSADLLPSSFGTVNASRLPETSPEVISLNRSFRFYCQLHEDRGEDASFCTQGSHF